MTESQDWTRGFVQNLVESSNRRGLWGALDPESAELINAYTGGQTNQMPALAVARLVNLNDSARLLERQLSESPGIISAVASDDEFDATGEAVSSAARIEARRLSVAQIRLRLLVGVFIVYVLVAATGVVLALTVSVARYALANAILSGSLSLVGGLVGVGFGFYFESKD